MILNKLVDRVTEVFSDYKGTAFNSIVILFTGGSQQLLVLFSFKCPCVEPNELPASCRNLTDYGKDFSCMTFVNQIYGFSFIFIPAIGLFIFGLVLKQKLWRAITGHLFKEKTERREKSKFRITVASALTRSLLYPVAWISLALLDGRFLACALTSMPYELEKSYKNCWMVAQTEEPKTSHWYEANRRLSQTFGLVVIVSFFVCGFIIYTVSRCLLQHTFFQNEYFKEYRRKEREILKREAKSQADIEAEESVKEFFKNKYPRKSKKIWDKISSIYDVPQDDPELGDNSNLQAWANQERETKL